MGSYGWGMALGFVLVVVAVASLIILRSFPEESLKVTARESTGRSFKGEVLSVPVRIGSRPGVSVARVELVSVPKGLEAKIQGDRGERILHVKSQFAGVYRGIRVKVGVLDPLRIMARHETHEVPFSFEFLPTYLLARVEPPMVAAAMLGDYPAGRSGFGQEFHTAEMYTTSRSSKDIMWRRLAKSPSEDLLARVGEANIPETLTVCLAEDVKSADRRSPSWMDLFSEAVARLGLPVVTIGITFRVVHVVGGSNTVAEARDARSLADLIVGLWGDEGSEKTELGPRDSDVVLTSREALDEPSLLRLVLDKPSVVVSWGRGRATLGSGMVFFTGNEDVSGLIARVLSR